MKKSIAFLAAIMTLMSLTACSDTGKDGNLYDENESAAVTQNTESNENNSTKQIDESIPEENDNIIYQNDNVVVTKSEPLVSPNIVCNSWDIPTETEMYNSCDIIADVTIISLKEVAISYTFMGTECTSYKTLADVSVNTNYYSADGNINQEFTVAIPNSSYSFDESFPEITVGERCILFISDTEELDDYLELDKYADYYLSSPADIINIYGDECQANNIFASYSNSTVSVTTEANTELLEGEFLIESEESSDNEVDISTEQCIMPFDDFESMLIAKINENHKE